MLQSCFCQFLCICSLHIYINSKAIMIWSSHNMLVWGFMQSCFSVLTLCVRVCSQVALGDSNELLDADYQANKLPAGKHSTKGMGQTGPDPKNSITLLVCCITHSHISYIDLRVLTVTQQESSHYLGARIYIREETIWLNSSEIWQIMLCMKQSISQTPFMFQLFHLSII